MSYLIHYNHNHDKLGRFARSNWSGASYDRMADFGKYKRKRATSKELYKAGKALYKDYQKSGNFKRSTPEKRNLESRSKVAEQARESLSKDKEYLKQKELYQKALKRYDNAVDSINVYYTNPNVDWDKAINSKDFIAREKEYHDAEKALNAQADKYTRERNRITDRFLNKYADATISDLKLSNTDEVRDYIIRNTTDNWSDEHNPGSYSSFLKDKTERQKEKYNATHVTKRD